MLARQDTLLQEIYAVVKQTGEYQLSYFRSLPLGTGDTKNGTEMVSQIDVESEQQLHEGLTALLPGSTFYGEETIKERNGTYTWVVDPLDGTANYLSGYDQWSISVALLSGEAVEAAGVYRPFSGEWFCAAKGKGAFYQGKKLPKHSSFSLSSSLVATGFPYRSVYSAGAFFPCAEEILYACRGIRRGGSAALDLCFLAAGFLQGFWEIDLQPYDTAAGVLMMQETGCEFTDFFGAPYKIFSSTSLVAGLPGVHKQMQDITARHYSPIKS